MCTSPVLTLTARYSGLVDNLLWPHLIHVMTLENHTGVNDPAQGYP